jgi:hypothetical protein
MEVIFLQPHSSAEMMRFPWYKIVAGRRNHAFVMAGPRVKSGEWSGRRRRSRGWRRQNADARKMRA